MNTINQYTPYKPNFTAGASIGKGTPQHIAEFIKSNKARLPKRFEIRISTTQSDELRFSLLNKVNYNKVTDSNIFSLKKNNILDELQDYFEKLVKKYPIL